MAPWWLCARAQGLALQALNASSCRPLTLGGWVRRGRAEEWPERVRGWPEVTQQWDKRAQDNVWAEDEVAVVQSRGRASPRPRQQGPSALLSCPPVFRPSLPSLTSFLSCLSLSIESPHLFPSTGLAKPECVWGEPCLARHSSPFSCTLGSPSHGGSKVRGYGFKSRLCCGTSGHVALPALSLSSLFSERWQIVKGLPSGS